MKAIHLFSGGLDSTTLLWEFVRGEHYQNCTVECLCFDYGQTHRCELNHAKALAEMVGVPVHMVEMPRMYERCALVGAKEIPMGLDATDPAQKATIVPNRNMILIAVAAAYGLEHGGTFVSWAINKDDAAIFPDCRPDFFQHLNNALCRCHTRVIDLHAPFMRMTKRQVVSRAREIGVPIELTWSCYNPQDERPCGECAACKTREAALS